MRSSEVDGEENDKCSQEIGKIEKDCVPTADAVYKNKMEIDGS